MQSDIIKVEQTIDMMVIKIDLQKYEEYLWSGSVNLTETWRYRYVKTKIRELGDEEIIVIGNSLSKQLQTHCGKKSPFPSQEGVMLFLPERNKNLGSRKLKSETKFTEQGKNQSLLKMKGWGKMRGYIATSRSSRNIGAIKRTS